MLNIVATCCNVVATCWTLVQLLFSNNYTFWRELEMAERICCCRFVLRALSPLTWSVDKKKTNKQKLSPELVRIYPLAVPSVAAVSTRAVFLMSRFLWSFDLISHRHGKVSSGLISWLVLSKLTPFELSWFQLFGRHVDISTKARDTKLENDCVTAGSPVKGYLGSRIRRGGLFERWPQDHRVKTSVMSSFPSF